MLTVIAGVNAHMMHVISVLNDIDLELWKPFWNGWWFAQKPVCIALDAIGNHDPKS